MWGITEKIEEKTWQAIEGVTDEETYSEAKERAEVRRSDHVVVFIFVLGAVTAVVHLVIVYRLLYISKHLDVCGMFALWTRLHQQLGRHHLQQQQPKSHGALGLSHDCIGCASL